MKLFRLLTLALIGTLACRCPLSIQAANPEPGGEKKRDPAMMPIQDVPGLPRVLLIGDSISIGYTLPVRKLLESKANVHRIPANGDATSVGLKKLPQWLGTQKWDVIHFNWGLHDLKHWNWETNQMDLKCPSVNTLEQYESNLRELVRQLQATGAKLVWASTTPVPAGSPGRQKGAEIAYNAVAERIMKEAQIPINDLHAASETRIQEIQKPKNVHFTPEGCQYLGEQVAKAIEAQLPTAR